jgi:hypothetical protein
VTQYLCRRGSQPAPIQMRKPAPAEGYRALREVFDCIHLPRAGETIVPINCETFSLLFLVLACGFLRYFANLYFGRV